MENAQYLVLRAGWVREWPEDIEDRAHAEVLAHRRRVLHRRVVCGREHEADADLVKRLPRFPGREGDLRAKRLEPFGTARRGCHRAPHMLRYLGAGRRGDECGAG